MSGPSSNIGETLNADVVNSAKIVVLMSHDLDDYSVIQYSVRREFAIGEVSTLLVSNSDLGIPPTTAGLQFKKFAGREVQGYFCPPESLIAGNLLSKYDGEGLVLIQLVPDIASYSKIRAILRALDEGKPEISKHIVTDGEMMRNGQKVSEVCFTNQIGAFQSMVNARNNPFTSLTRTDKGWINDPALNKILNEPKFMQEFLVSLKISYLLHRFEPLNASLRLMKN